MTDHAARNLPVGRCQPCAGSGWGLGMWLGVPAGNLLWFGASLVMSLWLLGFGAALRHGGTAPEANPARD